MEQHIIPLNKGIHLTPSVGEDGELLDAINLMPKNGSLRNVPVLKKRQIGQQDETIKIGKIVCIHKVNGGENILSADTDDNQISIYLNPDTEPIEPIEPILELGSDVTISRLETIGNVVVILASDGMHYLLWKHGEYKSLGTHMPELGITFGLQGECKWQGQLSLEINDWPSGSISSMEIDITNYVKYPSSLTQTVLAHVNKFLKEEAYDKGKFVEPFFVRYAYRLYDDSLVMHSAPILMPCCTGMTPLILADHYTYAGQISFTTYALLHDLDYSVNSNDKAELQEWSDIIKSVDIFISKPIRRYDQNGEVKTISPFWYPVQYDEHGLTVDEVDFQGGYSVCKLKNQNDRAYPPATFPHYYQRIRFGEAICRQSSSETFTQSQDWVLNIPQRPNEEYVNEIKDTSNFYLLASIPVKDLKEERTIIRIPSNFLNTIETYERMTDDYNSHDDIIPSSSFVYNSRLNISKIQRWLFDGTAAQYVAPYAEQFKNTIRGTREGTPESYTIKPEVDRETTAIPKEIAEIFVEIDDGNTTQVVKCSSSYVHMVMRYPNYFGVDPYYQPQIPYFFYPNRNAKRAYIRTHDATSGQVYTVIYPINLEPHALLNGAFYFDDFKNPWYDSSAVIPGLVKNAIEESNKIYTSDVNNPFVFPPKGINTVGTGDVIGIRSANKALSQGQFGQFPLYAFCSDGIWALETKDDGTYRPSQPINRDVCSNPNSILQIDDAVIYATKQGLKLIRGSETSLLTPQFEAHQEAYTENVEWASALPPSPLVPEGEEPFSPVSAPNLIELLQNQDTKLSFDGINRIVHVYGEHNSRTHYILSLDNGEWVRTTQPTPIAFVDGYPNAVLQIGDSNNTLYEYINAGTGKDTFMHGFVITRETALGNPLVMKSLQDLKMLRRYYNQNSAVRVIPYVSNDRMHWSRLTSLRQRSCKWIRFAIYTKLTDADMLEGMALLVDKRMTNKLR